MTWLKDDNGNKCSVEYFGTKEAAQNALDSLKNCRDCTNCSRCSYKKNKKGDFVPPPTPKIENIHAAIFAAVSAPKALDMSAWHTCGTTHCRAGWTVHLAGEAGYALERFHNTALAAQLIYEASGYKINPGRFYDNNAEALADMKKLAEAS